MSRYRYGIQHQYMGEWVPMIGMQEESLGFLQGYIFGRRDSEGCPCNGLRLVRSDGKVMDERRGDPTVAIGMIAGFPSAEQYEGAAEWAIDKANAVRAMSKGRPSDC